MFALIFLKENVIRLIGINRSPALQKCPKYRKNRIVDFDQEALHELYMHETSDEILRKAYSSQLLIKNYTLISMLF